MEYCAVVNSGRKKGDADQLITDMDKVADAIADTVKPSFFYLEERQQNLFRCEECGDVNDVLGIYAYCGLCGTRNDLQELKKTINGRRDRINAGGPYESFVKESVAAFDSLAAQYAKQLLARIPLTPARKNTLRNMLFHNLKLVPRLFLNMFDINILRGINAQDISFSELMFFRRHVYEHNGGEVDANYIKNSGDSVRLKQKLQETQESAHRIAGLVVRFAENLHAGFHEIFPPLADPIKSHKERKMAIPRNPIETVLDRATKNE